MIPLTAFLAHVARIAPQAAPSRLLRRCRGGCSALYDATTAGALGRWPLPRQARRFARNGLRVIVARREGVPLVSAELVALSGAEVDPPRLSGLAALSASLMTQGNGSRSPARRRRRSARLLARQRRRLEQRAGVDHGERRRSSTLRSRSSPKSTRAGVRRPRSSACARRRSIS